LKKQHQTFILKVQWREFTRSLRPLRFFLYDLCVKPISDLVNSSIIKSKVVSIRTEIRLSKSEIPKSHSSLFIPNSEFIILHSTLLTFHLSLPTHHPFFYHIPCLFMFDNHFLILIGQNLLLDKPMISIIFLINRRLSQTSFTSPNRKFYRLP
jgi:hypothetical protein